MAERLGPFAAAVTSVVPAGFEAYCRVYHPTLDGRRWREVAAASGRVVHPQMQWEGIAVGDWEEPCPGFLPERVREPMVEVLRRHTATPGSCWFAVWEGWGDLPPEVAAAPTFEAPHRRYHVVAGPIEAVGDVRPSLWWPDDRAWCVATEIDLVSTYVGGTRGCIAELAAHPALEADEVAPSDGITRASDTVNP